MVNCRIDWISSAFNSGKGSSDPTRSIDLERIIQSEPGTSFAQAEGAGSIADGRDANGKRICNVRWQ